MDEYGAVGLSFAVVKDGRIIYSDALGYKDREQKIQLYPDDFFRIASVTKTFVATAIMQLVENGKLSLDDDINKYLGFRIRNPHYSSTPITVKMLLCHRSSLNDSQGFKTFDKVNPATNPQYTKCYCDYAPGEDYIYCNLNYNLLGAIIENVTGLRFDEYIRKHILKPLRLHGRFNVMDLDSTRFAQAYRYRKEKDAFFLVPDAYLPRQSEIRNYKLGYSVPYLSAAGGLKITVSELARYMTMHMLDGKYKRKQILSSESEHLMREVQTRKSLYALSLKHYKKLIPHEELVGQTGGAYGIHTAMIFHPEKKYGFVVFCNGCKSKSTDGHELNFEIIRCLFNTFIIDSK